MESESKVLLDKIHRKIRKLYSHVFIFMRASPIVEAIPKDPLKEPLVLDFTAIPMKKKSREIAEKEENNQNNQNNIQNNQNNNQNTQNSSFIRKVKRCDSRKVTAINLTKKEFIMKNLGFSFLMSSSFKKNIVEKLSHLQITVKFEVLNKKNLIETLTKVLKHIL